MATNRKISHTPPADLVPAGLRELNAEHDRLRAEHNRAKIVLRDLLNNQLDVKAKAEDDAVVAKAVRAGKTPKSATPATDKLKADRIEAAVREAQFKAALVATNADIFAWLESNTETLTTHMQHQLNEAAQEYQDAVEVALSARIKYHTARAAKAWGERAVEPRDSSLGWNPVQVDPLLSGNLREDAHSHERKSTRVAARTIGRMAL